MLRSPSSIRFQLAGSILLVFLAAGCGTRLVYPVSGQIVDKEGKPVTGIKGGAVEFESLDHQASANGAIDEDGKFRLTTLTPGDGAHLGKNRVLITRPYFGPEQPAPHVIHPKYQKYQTSGLVVEVEPKNNQITLTVDLAK